MHPITAHQIATLRMAELHREADMRRRAAHRRPVRLRWRRLRRHDSQPREACAA